MGEPGRGRSLRPQDESSAATCVHRLPKQTPDTAAGLELRVGGCALRTAICRAEFKEPYPVV